MKKKLSLLIAVALVGMFLIAGCGSGGSGAS